MEIQNHFERWMRHRSVLHELLDLIGTEHIDYKPWNDAFPVGALVSHIAVTSHMFIQSVKNGQLTPPSSSDPFETMEDLRHHVREYTEKTKSIFNQLSDIDLKRQLEIGQFIGTGKMWLDTMVDHEIHHKGQLFTYFRLIGINNVPFYNSLPSKA